MPMYMSVHMSMHMFTQASMHMLTERSETKKKYCAHISTRMSTQTCMSMHMYAHVYTHVCPVPISIGHQIMAWHLALGSFDLGSADWA